MIIMTELRGIDTEQAHPPSIIKLQGVAVEDLAHDAVVVDAGNGATGLEIRSGPNGNPQQNDDGSKK